jgi:hypothetical protein
VGFSITWCAVREAEADRFVDAVGLRPTPETEEYPESPFSMAVLDNGWRVIWCNEYGSPALDPKAIEAASMASDVLLCLVEEHVMASSSELWSQGKRKWKISHEGENGPKGLDSSGELPECFKGIKAEMEQAQIAEGGEAADVDYIFEIPLKVAQSIVGFKHDEDCSHIKTGFVVLSASAPEAKKSIFQRLFNR